MSNGEYCKTKNAVLYSSSSSVKFQATAAAHWLCALRRIPDGENQEILCALEVWSLESKDLHLGKIFNDPRFLHLPIYRKALKELTWDCCAFWLAVSFSFLTIYFFPSKRHVYVSWLLPCIFRAVLQSYLRVCLLGCSLSVKSLHRTHKIALNLNFFFFHSALCSSVTH